MLTDPNPLAALLVVTLAVIVVGGAAGRVYELWPRIKTWLRLPGAAWVSEGAERLSDGEYRINSELWELLKDEDPEWLMAMGIEEPEYSKRGRSAMMYAGEIVGVTPVLFGKPVVAGGVPQRDVKSYQNVDRSVEQRLEEILLAGEQQRGAQYSSAAMGFLGTVAGGPLGGTVGGAIGATLGEKLLGKNDKSH